MYNDHIFKHNGNVLYKYFIMHYTMTLALYKIYLINILVRLCCEGQRLTGIYVPPLSALPTLLVYILWKHFKVGEYIFKCILYMHIKQFPIITLSEYYYICPFSIIKSELNIESLEMLDIPKCFNLLLSRQLVLRFCIYMYW